jgi:hypothetical protein
MAMAVELRRCRLSTPFSTLYEYCANRIQTKFKFPVYNPGLVDTFHNLLIFRTNVATIFVIIKFGAFLLSNLAEFHYQIWHISIIKFGEFFGVL